VKIQAGEIGITGANFIVADTGSIAVTENEGNGRLCASFPKTHIVITGIEKVIPSLTDLALFWPCWQRSEQVSVLPVITP
jgi:L-lactate dehydrogenase complex protein LldF